MVHDHTQCRELLSSLSQYIDGELDEALCARIERHMEGCERCQVVVDTLRKTVYLYHVESDDDSLPSDVRQRLFRSLDLDDLLNT